MKRMLVAGCVAIATMAAFAGTENGEDEFIKKDVEVGRLAYAAGYGYAHGKGVERDLEKSKRLACQTRFVKKRSMTRAMAPSPATLHAVPNPSIAT